MIVYKYASYIYINWYIIYQERYGKQYEKSNRYSTCSYYHMYISSM